MYAPIINIKIRVVFVPPKLLPPPMLLPPNPLLLVVVAVVVASFDGEFIVIAIAIAIVVVAAGAAAPVDEYCSLLGVGCPYHTKDLFLVMLVS